MPEENARGRFVWHDLVTTDTEAAKAFYTAVVGWGTHVWEGPKPYTMWTIGGETPMPIGGIMDLPAEAAAGGARPHWLAYVSVSDVDATAARAQELGGTIVHPATDIPTVGRFAIINDPQGATIALFTPAAGSGQMEPPTPIGQFSWHELTTTDQEAAFSFYSDLFGWEKRHAHDMGPMGVYQMYGLDGKDLGGMFNKDPGMPGPAWNHYVRVPDVHRAAEIIRAQGGQVINGPMEVPGGDWIVMGLDPQGGMFALHQVMGGAQS